MHKILLLEDDLNLRDTIVEELEDEGFNLTATDKSDEVIDLTYEEKFDLYLFDVNVIGMNGFKLLEALREAGDETPTIFLTSKNKTQDVIDGFDVGASDYLKKPFDIDELIARMFRFLKQKKVHKLSETVSYFPESLEVQNNDKKILLNQKDAKILEYFLAHKAQVISKEQILEDVYEGEFITDSTFRGYIKKIKSAIGEDHIRNIRGQGYIFEAL
ncbi:MAG: Two-component system response regulator [uncultured Sulfurovum sp.]|uniref:Two-component system response regulator n=1 Tax=uncultured Sulfurovum sp. TaxID=269237 RepID=A0A6S6SV46_9BACT|nr:MAG: Two-component system response regulator [uncultured Sulfurovum sp.]